MLAIEGFRFLHVSDLHFELEVLPTDSLASQVKQKKMGEDARQVLADDIREGKLGFREFDYIFITGDVFFRNNDISSSDFAEDPLLQALRQSVPNDGHPHIFWCCGNHDINETDPVNKLEKYYGNYKNVTGCDLPENFESMHWFRRTKDFNLLILNTNSKSIDKDLVEVIKSKNQDTGKPDIIQVYSTSLQKLLAKRDNAKPTLVIGHHGLNWFSNESQIEIAKLFEKHDVDFYLCGHDHRLGYSELDYSGKGIHQITCGGCRHDGYGVFSVVCGEYKNMLYHFTPYRYHHDGDAKWGADFNLHRKLPYKNVFMRADIEKSIRDILWSLWETPEFNGPEKKPTDVLKFIEEMLEEIIKTSKMGDRGISYIRDILSTYVYNYEDTKDIEMTVDSESKPKEKSKGGKS